MANLNQRINLSGNANANMRIYDNDNSIIIEGQSSEGWISRSILKDDPDLKTKVMNLLSNLQSYQKTELEKFVNNALNQFDDKVEEMNIETEKFIDDLS